MLTTFVGRARRAIKPALVIGVAALTTACASREQAAETGDPFEPLNRGIYSVNMALDDAVLEPAANVYTTVTPEPARDGVQNFMTNLNQPVVFANTLLQGDVRASVETFGRFTVNTIFGIGGVFDVASAAGVEQHQEDFGQTLAVWGVADGPFIMLPVLGPSSLRDGTGRFVDRYPHPLNWNAEYSQSTWAWGVRGLNGLDTRARAQGVFTTMESTAIDPYVQVRSAYRQLRASQIANENGDAFGELPDFSADYDEDE
ncbi:MlaA family lipoprotein [Marinicauda sp. Alg238-R41]|uniref:MlaA family lipoprotein n=1 Tax=Marinicauda sp. Alg238-R41 TaxID=2993447 RepID=UPI0022E6E921|nr:VacJ family lipoprotein [Marinicauda sp. Alg238-R41]